MCEIMNFAFNSLTDDEFIDIVRQNPTNNRLENINCPFEDYVSNKHNMSTQELSYDFDSHDPFPSPTCAYVTENQFKQRNMNINDEKFMLLHLNIRSISRNFDNLRLLLANPHQQPCSVIGLTETWLSADTSQSFVLPGFDLVTNNRIGRIGGGV